MFILVGGCDMLFKLIETLITMLDFALGVLNANIKSKKL